MGAGAATDVDSKTVCVILALRVVSVSVALRLAWLLAWRVV
jgi:hypothetical protein